MAPDASIVIPTLGTRLEALERAIASVLAQEGYRAEPLVVLNGARHAADLPDRLRARDDIRFLQIATPSVSAARVAGRRAVTAPYFGFLDDDDELLPNALRVRIEAFRPEVDVVITNGLLRDGDAEEVIFPGFDPDETDHARALLEEQWFASNGCLFDSARVGTEPFEDLPDHVELTVLAFRLATRHAIRKVDAITFAKNGGEAGQVSLTWDYLKRVPAVLAELETLTGRRDLRRLLRRKRSAALHQCSENRRRAGELAAAWRYHLRSLLLGGGYRYAPYSRHLLRGPRT